MRNSLFVGLLLLVLHTQGQGIYFNNRYTNDTTAYQSGITSLVATDSGYVTFGQANNYPVRGGKSLMLRGLNRRGQQRWQRYYGRPGYRYYSPGFGNGEALAQSDGGFTMASGVDAPQRQKWPMLWRFTAQGDTLWTRTYRQLPIGGGAYAGCRTADGGYALAGFIGRGQPPTEQRALLIRTDAAGQLRWWREYESDSVSGAAYNTTFFTVYPTPDGGFILSGTASGIGYAPYFVKTDSLGQMQWQRLLGTPQRDEGKACARPTRDGGYIVGAERYAGTINQTPVLQLVLYKLDSLGRTVWQRPMGAGRETSSFSVIHELPDGSFVGAGQQDDADSANINHGRGYPQGFALSVCADGDSLWFRSYKKLRGGRSHNYLRDFQPTPDGGFVGGGFLFPYTPDTGSYDSWVFKVDSVGNMAPRGPKPNARASCYVAPPPLGTAGGGAGAHLAAFARAYPSPTTGAVQVDYHLPDAQASGQLLVYDPLGHLLRTVALTEHTATVALDLTALPAGLYFYAVQARGQLVAKGKLVKQL